MGKKGPMPERSDLRIRRNKPEGGEVSKGVAMGFAGWPSPGEWDSSVIRFYNSFKNSGIVSYYEATDVEMIWQACDELNVHRNDSKRSAMRFDVLMKHLSAFGATEDGRRRMRIELEAPATGTEMDPELALAEEFMNNPIITGG